MKFKCAAAIAALLVGAPLMSAAAPDAKKAEPPAKEAKAEKAEKPAKEAKAATKETKPEKEAAKPAKDAKDAKPAKDAKEAPLPEKPDEAAVAKALKAKKPMYTRFADAKEAAWNCQQPLFVALLADNDEKSKKLESKALRQKAFVKDFAPANCVLLIWRLKPSKPEVPQYQGRGRRRAPPPPKPTTIEARTLKTQESDFLTKFAVSQQAKSNAKKRGGPELKFTSISCYPTIVCVDPGCRKLYFRDPKYDASLGSPNASFGAWLTQTVDMFRKTKRELVISPAVQKILDNPTEPKKWK